MKKTFIDTTAVEKAVVEFRETLLDLFLLEDYMRDMVLNGIGIINVAKKGILEALIISYKRKLKIQLKAPRLVAISDAGDEYIGWDVIVESTEYIISDLQSMLVNISKFCNLARVFELVNGAKMSLNKRERNLIEIRMDEMMQVCNDVAEEMKNERGGRRGKKLEERVI